MFFQNDNYMQDLNYYNQNVMPNCMNPYYTNFMMNSNIQQMQNNDYSAMYPAIYRIVYPVVCQVMQNSNMRVFSEDTLNSLVDSVYNIVEGDINLDENNKSSQNLQDTNCNRANSSQNGSSLNNQNQVKKNYLLRDLIKIIFLDNLPNYRRNTAQMMNNFNMNQGRFM